MRQKYTTGLITCLFGIPIIYYYNFELNMDKIKIKDSLLKDDKSSETWLSVTKKVKDSWDKENINVYENEKKWLLLLKDSGIIAKPMSFNDKERLITTKYVGERINKTNLPYDWEIQKKQILDTLKKYNCRHNDIKPDELRVQNGKITLIDLGWANPLDQPNPENWPTGLGDKFKGEEYDDEVSFDLVIKHIQKECPKMWMSLE